MTRHGSRLASMVTESVGLPAYMLRCAGIALERVRGYASIISLPTGSLWLTLLRCRIILNLGHNPRGWLVWRNHTTLELTEYTPAEELALAECVLITPDQDIWAHTTDFISEHNPLPPTTVYLNELNLVCHSTHLQFTLMLYYRWYDLLCQLYVNLWYPWRTLNLSCLHGFMVVCVCSNKYTSG